MKIVLSLTRIKRLRGWKVVGSEEHRRSNSEKYLMNVIKIALGRVWYGLDLV
jgi:hypothetical protein